MCNYRSPGKSGAHDETMHTQTHNHRPNISFPFRSLSFFLSSFLFHIIRSRKIPPCFLHMKIRKATAQKFFFSLVQFSILMLNTLSSSIWWSCENMNNVTPKRQIANDNKRLAIFHHFRYHNTFCILTVFLLCTFIEIGDKATFCMFCMHFSMDWDRSIPLYAYIMF